MTRRLDIVDLTCYQGSMEFAITKRMLNDTIECQEGHKQFLTASCRKKLKTPNGKLNIQDAVSFFITNNENR